MRHDHHAHVIVGKPEKILAMDKFDRITFDPRIMGGRACIRGMREDESEASDRRKTESLRVR